jgi:hypothetical protein
MVCTLGVDELQVFQKMFFRKAPPDECEATQMMGDLFFLLPRRPLRQGFGCCGNQAGSVPAFEVA